MKTYLVMACVAAALVGCSHNRGGMRSESDSQSGKSDSYDRSLQSTNSTGAPSNSSGTSNGTSSSNNSGQQSTGNQNTSSPGSINSDSSK